jgi:ubiquinone/menaquinone biosynthesis C-methylase UbiE
MRVKALGLAHSSPERFHGKGSASTDGLRRRGNLALWCLVAAPTGNREASVHEDAPRLAAYETMGSFLRSRLKTFAKALLRFPADAFIRSSRALPERIDIQFSKRIGSYLMEYAGISGKYYPYKDDRASHVLLKPTNNRRPPPESDFPVPPPRLWLCSEGTPEDYLSSGREHVEKMMSILRPSGVSLQPGHRILDFGCGTGRMLRWLRNKAGECIIWGVDIQAQHIAWCQGHLSPPFRFATTTSLPHLPFEDRYFDFIYAGSVFTHIADLADAWLLELRRVLVPGGKLYITIQDKHSIDIILKFPPNHHLYWLRRLLLSFQEESSFMNSDFAMLTITRAPTTASVFYDSDYFCEQLKHSFKILSVAEEAYWFQTAILLEK